MDELEILKRKLAREKAARKQAERILEDKALELYRANSELIEIHDSQEAELRNRIAEIKDKELTYRNLIENASDLIYSCNVLGIITYANPMVINLFGYSEEELIGSNFRDFISPEYKKRVQGHYAFQLSEKLPSTYTEFPVINSEGKEIWIGQTVDLSIKDEIVINVLARDISDRKKVEKSLMRSEEKYKSIIENMELGLLEVDKNGKIIRAYPKFSQLTGYENEELIGKDAALFFLSGIELEKMKVRNRNRLAGEAEVYEVKLNIKDGSKKWVLISAAPYYNEKGIVEGSIGIHLDISLQKDLEEDLRHANRLAEDSLKAKDLFLANISHEIRTPLNAIIGISELMLESMPTESQKKYLETIMASGDNLLCLINEILDFSKINSGKLILRKEPVNLSTLIEHVHRSSSVIGSKKGLTVNLISEIEPEQHYLTDATRLQEVLFNLVGNAVKFTETGSVSIEIKRLSTNNFSDLYSFEIIDTGVGIPEDDLDDVFNMFVQATNTNLVSESGTGLGLSISNGIIEKMGGDLKVSSILGKGSRFQFSIELERAVSNEEKVKVSKISSAKRKLEGFKILIVEDVEVNRFLANSILTNWGCVVSESVNGLDSTEALKTQTFDLVLMDVRMPIMGGFEATRIIRQELGLNNLPIIALTANAIEGEMEKCKAVGMNDYLSKPFSQDELYQILMKYLSSEPQVGPLTTSLINLKGIDAITGGDKVFQKRMVNLFREETKINIQSLHDAIENRDEDSIVRIAHTMKAATAHICTNDIVSEVRSIEIDNLLFDERSEKVSSLIVLLEKMLDELLIFFPK